MKQKIHPKYYSKVKASCACGASFVVGSTESEIKTELCSACHPFYTGKQKLVDTARRVDKFKKRTEQKQKLIDRKGKKAKRQVRASKKSEKKKEVVVKLIPGQEQGIKPEELKDKK